VVRFYSNPRDTGEGKMVIGDILVTISSTGINPGFVLIANSIAVRTVSVRQSIIATATKFTIPRITPGFTGEPGPSGRLHKPFERGTCLARPRECLSTCEWVYPSRLAFTRISTLPLRALLTGQP
jgi:hypothetical protein